MWYIPEGFRHSFIHAFTLDRIKSEFGGGVPLRLVLKDIVGEVWYTPGSCLCILNIL